MCMQVLPVVVDNNAAMRVALASYAVTLLGAPALL